MKSSSNNGNLIAVILNVDCVSSSTSLRVIKIFFRYKANKMLAAEAEILHLKLVQAYKVSVECLFK